MKSLCIYLIFLLSKFLNSSAIQYKYQSYQEILRNIKGFEDKYSNYIRVFDASSEINYIPDTKCGEEL